LQTPSAWKQLEINTSNPSLQIYDKIIESKETNADADTQYARWFLKVYASPNAQWGNHTAKLVFTAHDSSSG